MSLFYTAFQPTATPLGINQAVEIRKNPFGLTLPLLEAKQDLLIESLMSFVDEPTWKFQSGVAQYGAAIIQMATYRDGTKILDKNSAPKEIREAAQKLVNKGFTGTLQVKATNLKLCKMAGISPKTGLKYRRIFRLMGLVDFVDVKPGSTFEPPTLTSVNIGAIALLVERLEVSLRTYAGSIGETDNEAVQTCTDRAWEVIQQTLEALTSVIPLFNALTENVAQYNRDIKERVNRAAEELGKMIHAGIELALDILPSPDIPDFEQTPSLFGWNAQAKKIMRKYRSNRMQKVAAPA
jgi:hypothetical protein